MKPTYYILETGPTTYIGGDCNSHGYGETKVKALAICFRSVADAKQWLDRNDRDAAIIRYDTLELA